jgi:hypothetical protein
VGDDRFMEVLAECRAAGRHRGGTEADVGDLLAALATCWRRSGTETAEAFPLSLETKVIFDTALRLALRSGRGAIALGDFFEALANSAL